VFDPFIPPALVLGAEGFLEAPISKTDLLLLGILGAVLKADAS
jgi:hypothetical protein